MNADAGGSASGREVVLDRIRNALRDAPPRGEISRSYQQALDPAIDIIALFVERVEDYRAIVHRTTLDGLAASLAGVLATRGARRIAVPEGISRGWLARATVEAVNDDPPLSRRELDALDGVVTGCAVAIAETGTIVLDAGPDQGRRALSLLPDHHVCVVRVDQVVGTVPEALRRLEPRRPLTWISGPSATSDIELQRVEGVHGPRHLDVLLVAAPEGAPA
jgi:L-lactate dehydrogenase complex protein LldG